MANVSACMTQAIIAIRTVMVMLVLVPVLEVVLVLAKEGGI